jgi:DNA-3-methyladenine glycosylase II
MIKLSVPKQFDFQQTINMLQRGPHDPINMVGINHWTRCFRVEKNIVLLQTTKNKSISTKILSGNIRAAQHKSLIEESLGLDDPILLEKVQNIPYGEKINSVLGLTVPGYPDFFEAIVQIIIGQQVSVSAANKIRANFIHQFGGTVVYDNQSYKHFPHPETVLKKSVEALRMAGLSQNKAKSVLHVAEAFHQNSDIQQLNKKSLNNDIYRLLMQLHGVGEWTVDWLLLRGFRRFEIIPSTDLFVRKAFAWWLNKKELMSAEQVKRYEQKLFPYGGVIAYRVLSAYACTLKRTGDI